MSLHRILYGMAGEHEWPGFEALPPAPPTEWPPGRPALPEPPDAPEPVVPPRRKGRVWWVAAGALALIALVGLLARRDSDEPTEVTQPDTTTVTTAATPPDPSTTSSTTTTAPPARPAVDEATMRAEVDELSRFVERERGLAFQRPVHVEALGDTDFRARLAEMSTPQRAADEARGAMLEALGIIPQTLDYAGQLETLRMNFLDGFYESETDRLVVRLTAITPEHARCWYTS